MFDRNEDKAVRDKSAASSMDRTVFFFNNMPIVQLMKHLPKTLSADKNSKFLKSLKSCVLKMTCNLGPLYT